VEAVWVGVYRARDWGERAGAGRVAHRRRGGRAVGHGSGPPEGAQPGALGASL